VGLGLSSPPFLLEESSLLPCKSAQFVMEQDPDLGVVEAVLVILQPLIVLHMVVMHDSIDCPEGLVQDTAQEDTVVVVQSLDFCNASGSSEFADTGLGPGVSLFPGPMVIVGHGTLGTGSSTGGG
jgi:hypothetical protein